MCYCDKWTFDVLDDCLSVGHRDKLTTTVRICFVYYLIELCLSEGILELVYQNKDINGTTYIEVERGEKASLSDEQFIALAKCSNEGFDGIISGADDFMIWKGDLEEQLIYIISPKTLYLLLEELSFKSND